MKKLKQDIISGYKISKNEALKLYDKNLDELIEKLVLYWKKHFL